jgi:hypothetical protein
MLNPERVWKYRLLYLDLNDLLMKKTRASNTFSAPHRQQDRPYQKPCWPARLVAISQQLPVMVPRCP